MLMALIKNNKRGFTLVELLIVIAIIGVLAAIAIPQFSNYRTKSYNSAAQVDLRNAITVQEAYFSDKKTYSAAVADLVGAPYGLFTSQNVDVSIVSSGVSGYTMIAEHSSGNKTWQVVGPGGNITEK